MFECPLIGGLSNSVLLIIIVRLGARLVGGLRLRVSSLVCVSCACACCSVDGSMGSPNRNTKVSTIIPVGGGCSPISSALLKITCCISNQLGIGLKVIRWGLVVKATVRVGSIRGLRLSRKVLLKM